jgi:hypothetical protein
MTRLEAVFGCLLLSATLLWQHGTAASCQCFEAKDGENCYNAITDDQICHVKCKGAIVLNAACHGRRQLRDFPSLTTSGIEYLLNNGVWLGDDKNSLSWKDRRDGNNMLWYYNNSDREQSNPWPC